VKDLSIFDSVFLQITITTRNLMLHYTKLILQK